MNEPKRLSSHALREMSSSRSGPEVDQSVSCDLDDRAVRIDMEIPSTTFPVGCIDPTMIVVWIVGLIVKG